MQADNAQKRAADWQAINERLKTALMRYAQDVGRESDYALSNRDSGKYEQRILVFRKDFVSLELLEVVTDILRDYPHTWRVFLLLGNRNGTLIVPPEGLCVSTLRTELVPQEVPTQEEIREWKETEDLYDALVQLFGSVGTDDACGNGDFWIIDDGWARRSHKICIDNIRVLTPRLVDKIQQLLSTKFPKCTVLVQVDAKLPGIDVPPSGLRIFASHIEYDWDQDNLRAIFKESFAW